MQINKKCRTSFPREVPWPPGRTLLWILNSSPMQCSFRAQVENRLSSSSTCSHMHPLQSNTEPGNRGWIQSLWAKGLLTLHSSLVSLWKGAGTFTSSFQQPYFKRSWQDRCWASPGSPDLLPLEPRTEKCPVAQSQVEICTSYSVLSNLGHSRLVHRHDYKHLGNLMVINN